MKRRDFVFTSLKAAALLSPCDWASVAAVGGAASGGATRAGAVASARGAMPGRGAESSDDMQRSFLPLSARPRLPALPNGDGRPRSHASGA